MKKKRTAGHREDHDQKELGERHLCGDKMASVSLDMF